MELKSMIEHDTFKDDNVRACELYELNNDAESNDSIQQKSKNIRQYLVEIFLSYQFHIAVVILITIDCMLVFGELIIDLKIFDISSDSCLMINGSRMEETSGSDKHHLETIEHIVHITSISLLALFIVEMAVKMFAFGWVFFHKVDEVVDAIITVVSFVLDIIFIDNRLLKFLGALIFIRLWRIVRIVHAIVTAVKSTLENEIEQEIEKRIEAENKLKIAYEQIEELKNQLSLTE